MPPPPAVSRQQLPPLVLDGAPRPWAPSHSQVYLGGADYRGGGGRHLCLPQSVSSSYPPPPFHTHTVSLSPLTVGLAPGLALRPLCCSVSRRALGQGVLQGPGDQAGVGRCGRVAHIPHAHLAFLLQPRQDGRRCREFPCVRTGSAWGSLVPQCLPVHPVPPSPPSASLQLPQSWLPPGFTLAPTPSALPRAP